MPRRGWQIVAVLAGVVSMSSLLALTVLQYSLPDAFSSIMGLGRCNIPHFRQNLGIPEASGLSATTFLLYFRALLVSAWFGYALMTVASLRGSAPTMRSILPLVVLLGIVLAFFWPASLSGDVYGYVGFARMYVYHGMNPYTHTPADLLSAGDPVARFTHFRHPSIYGPVWTLLSVTLVWLLKSSGVWWQVVALKLLSGVCLVFTAFVGRQIAERLSPGRGDLAFLSIGLNPLFLMEGPGGGHNDLLMVLLLLTGILYLLKRDIATGALALGGSVGVKFISAAIIPWAVWEFTKGKRNAQRIGLAIAAGTLAVMPVLMCYLPFWHGMALFDGAEHRLEWGEYWSSSSKEATLTYWLTRGLPDVWMDRVAELLTGPIPVLAVLVGLSIWIWKRGTDGSYMIGWIILALCLALLTMGVPFPWYFTWAWAVSLVRWNRAHMVLSGVCFVTAFICTMGYTVPR